MCTEGKQFKTEELDVLIQDYQLVANINEKCFDRLYSTISFLIVFYSAVIVFGASNQVQTSNFQAIIFLYVLPISTYLLGLFYCLNLFGVLRSTLYLTKLENKIHNCNIIPAEAWNWCNFCTKYSGKRVLTYGTGIMAFLLSPLAFHIWAFFTIHPPCNSCRQKVFFCFIPSICYLIYMVFSLIIISSMIKIKEEIEGK